MIDILISVVVPVFNAEHFLTECIESIVNQTYKYLEIILVNDGSTDDSLKICNQFAQKDKRVTVINQQNKGVVLARKQGVKNAHGKYIAFIDSDDYIALEYMETMLNNIGDADLATSSLIMDNRVWEDAIYEGTYDISKTTEVLRNLIYKEGGTCNGLVTNMTNKLFKTDIAKKVINLVDEKVYYGEDAEFVYKYILNCKSVVITKYKGYFYRKNNSSITHVVHDDFLISVNRMYLSLKKDFEKSPYRDILMPQLEKWIAMHIKIAPQKMGFGFSNINYIIPCKAKICNKKIVVYGAGNVGRDYIRQLQKENLCEDYIWVDKGYKFKDNYMGVEVRSPAEMMEHQFDYVIIAVNNEKVMNEIKKEIVKLGIDNKKIIWTKPLMIEEFYS